LTRQGINAAMIHGDRSQSQRTAALEGFQEGRYRVLVATDLAARGIHVQDIAHVINYDLPELAENFIHRVGRTGRAGGSGVASTLYSRDQRTEFFQLERTLGISMERMPIGAALPEPAARPERPARKDQVRSATDRQKPSSGAAKHSLIQLPGEFLQVQMEP
jgi:ATP-dependent RNA helicase RhlE